MKTQRIKTNVASCEINQKTQDLQQKRLIVKVALAALAIVALVLALPTFGISLFIGGGIYFLYSRSQSQKKVNEVAHSQILSRSPSAPPPSSGIVPQATGFDPGTTPTQEPIEKVDGEEAGRRDCSELCCLHLSARGITACNVDESLEIKNIQKPIGLGNQKNDCFCNVTFQMILQVPCVKELCKKHDSRFENYFAQYEEAVDKGDALSKEVAREIRQLFYAVTGLEKLNGNAEGDPYSVATSLLVKIDYNKSQQLHYPDGRIRIIPRVVFALRNNVSEDFASCFISQCLKDSKYTITLESEPSEFFVQMPVIKEKIKFKDFFRFTIPGNYVSSRENPVYECDFFTLHCGSEDTGHWTCVRKVGEKWFKMDDSIVTEILDIRDLLQEAHFLHYVKVTPKSIERIQKPVGLANRQNDCFSNAIFQFLLQVPYLKELCIKKNNKFNKYFDAYEKEAALSKENVFLSEEIAGEIRQLFYEVTNNEVFIGDEQGDLSSVIVSLLNAIGYQKKCRLGKKELNRSVFLLHAKNVLDSFIDLRTREELPILESEPAEFSVRFGFSPGASAATQEVKSVEDFCRVILPGEYVSSTKNPIYDCDYFAVHLGPKESKYRGQKIQGHYICLRKIGEEWFEVNDEIVTKVDDIKKYIGNVAFAHYIRIGYAP